jgi:hypothetical protein
VIVVMHRPPLKRIDYGHVRAVPTADEPESGLQKLAREAEYIRIWDAVTATAQASQQGETRE